MLVSCAAGQGVTIERRGTKAGHQYQLLGHSISGKLVVEPYLITLTEEAKPYTMFQHAGVEFIYMLTGKSLTAMPTRPIRWARRRADLRRRGPARPRGADQAAHDLSLHHRLSAQLNRISPQEIIIPDS